MVQRIKRKSFNLPKFEIWIHLDVYDLRWIHYRFSPHKSIPEWTEMGILKQCSDLEARYHTVLAPFNFRYYWAQKLICGCNRPHFWKFPFWSNFSIRCRTWSCCAGNRVRLTPEKWHHLRWWSRLMFVMPLKSHVRTWWKLTLGYG